MSNPYHNNYTCTITQFVENVCRGEISQEERVVYNSIGCQWYHKGDQKFKKTQTALDDINGSFEIVLAGKYSKISKDQKVVVSDGCSDLGTYKISFVRPGKDHKKRVKNYHLLCQEYYE